MMSDTDKALIISAIDSVIYLSDHDFRLSEGQRAKVDEYIFPILNEKSNDVILGILNSISNKLYNELFQVEAECEEAVSVD